jgi:threonyl-tRNA synthetase
MRIRGFTQDDSHIFCTEDQMADEIASLLDFILSVLRRFGFTEFEFNLSTKDPEKFVGSDEIWEKSTDALRQALDKYGFAYGIKEGDAAFYGPKIDVDVRDAIGRKWQLSTIQLDFNNPERFGLEYVGSDGQRHRPIMLHRALFGSIERFFGVLTEHYAGAFPAWLAPEQVRVLPVAAAHNDYADSVVKKLKSAGFRVDIDYADEPLGKRIRNGKTTKVPYVLVVGDTDVEAGTVGVNPRGGDVDRDVPLEAFIAQLRAEVSEGETSEQ